jgi:hypothetical protein
MSGCNAQGSGLVQHTLKLGDTLAITYFGYGHRFFGASPIFQCDLAGASSNAMY